ncbi:DNA polymerase Ligase family protein [Mycobacterium xenopi 3993]|nr:DNA polymerase Ligase family protein [Mycobacterium xenopi 3993]
MAAAPKTIRWSMRRSKASFPRASTGGGVIVWDRGTYTNDSDYDMAEGIERGHLSFSLHGEKLQGGYALTRIRRGKDEAWLLVKRKDEDADARRNPVRSRPSRCCPGALWTSCRDRVARPGPRGPARRAGARLASPDAGDLDRAAVFRSAVDL